MLKKYPNVVCRSVGIRLPRYVERRRKALSASNSLNATTLMKKLTETNPRKFLRIT